MTSNGYTYVVKIRRGDAVTLALPNFAVAGAAGPMAAWPTVRTSSTSRAIPARPAASRCPLIVSTMESAAVTPTIISTNRNSISTAPV